MKYLASLSLFALALSITTAACAADDHGHASKGRKAVCVLTPTEGNTVSGVVTFTETPDGVKVVGHVTGLEPGKHHGFHIHEFGDISAKDGMAAGGHFNPHGHDHGGPDADARHVGDLGNIEANEKGEGHYERLDKHMKLSGDDSIIGRGLIVHVGTDDFETQPTGNAGPRAAQGVIGVAKTE